MYDYDRTGDNSIEDGAFVGMIVKGFGARIINFALSAGSTHSGEWQAAGTNPVFYQTSSIRRCRVVDIMAISTAKRCVQVHNGCSSGVIEDIEITDVFVTCGPTSETPVSIVNDAGGVRRVRIRNLTLNVTEPTSVDQVMMQVVRVDGFVLDGGRLDPPGAASPTLPTLSLEGVVGGAIRNLSVGCRGPVGIRLVAAQEPPYKDFGLAVRPCRDVVIETCLLENVPAGGTGIAFVDAENCGARNPRFTVGLSAATDMVQAWVTVPYLKVEDPLAPVTYQVCFSAARAASGKIPAVPQSFVVTRSSDGKKVGQGFVGTRFAAQGLSFDVTSSDSTKTGDGFRIVVAAVTTGTAAALSGTATGCFVEGGALNGLAVSVAPGRGHRVADLFPATAATNYTGGAFDHPNTWNAAQSFTDVSFANPVAGVFGLKQAVATVFDYPVGGTTFKAVNAAGSYLLVQTATASSLDYIFYPADTLNGVSGDIVIVRNATPNYDLTLKDGTGNLSLGGDCTLNKTDDTLTLIRGGNNNWFELARSNNA